MEQFVIYYRVSTNEQGRSGLGLDAQRRDVDLFLDAFAERPFEVLGEFTDIASGAASDRPQLDKALDLVRREGATLLVAKLDRLSRKVAFLATLMEDKRVKLRVVSMPSADKFQLHIYAALAEQEREFISARTKAALAAAKDRGVQLGGLRDATGARNAVRKAEAKAGAEKIADIILPLQKSGKTLREIAAALDKAGVTTARGGQWSAVQVSRVLQRLEDN